MRRISKPLAVVVAIIVVGLLVSACGGGSAIPGNSVASVAGNPITTRAWKHWMFVAEKSQAAQSGSTQVIVPNDPPKFAGCIKQVHQQIPQLKKDSAATLRGDCKQLFTSLNSAVLGFLIQSYWYQADAHKLGYSVTPAQMKKALANAKKQVGTAAQFKTYQTQSAQTDADINFRVRVNTLFAKLVKRHTTKVDDAAISKYFNQHKSQFGTPETRDLRIVRTHTQARAQAALAALKGGQSWDAVAKQYSIDSATNQTGGVLKDVTNGQEEHALNQVAFSAPVNKLQGPVHGTFGWYVVEVTKITAATHQTLAQARPTIKQLLNSNSSMAAQKAATAAAQKAFGAQTLCRAAYSMADCHGYKAPPTTTAPAGAATAPAGAATTPAAGASTTPAGASTTPAGASTTPAAGASTTPAGGASTTPANGSGGSGGSSTTGH